MGQLSISNSEIIASQVQYGDYIRNKQKSYANIPVDKQISIGEMNKRLDDLTNKILHTV